MIFQLKNQNSPIIVAAIHDGHEIRKELKEYLALNEQARLREEDPFTGKWLSISDNTITTETSRFEVDLNRPREKAVYLKPEDSWGLKVWKSELPEEYYKDSIKKFDIFYTELEKQINHLLEKNKYVVVYDLHSYNYKRNGADAPPEDDIQNPELNLGTGTLDRKFWAPVIDRFITDSRTYNFMGRNIDVRENIKFKGGYLARWIHQKYPKSVCSLSIEFRKFFMDEWTGLPDKEIIAEIGKLLTFTVDGLLEELKKKNSK